MTKSYNDPFEHVDFNAIIDGCTGNGVVSGLTVTERGAGQNMSVDVAAGSALISWVKYTEASTVNVVITAADVTHPRKDIIIYDVATTDPAVVTGTPAAEPIPPDITSGDILLAVVNVAANETTIANTDIEDGKINVQDYHALEHETGGHDQVSFYDMHQDLTLHDNSTTRTVTVGVYTKYKETEINDCPDTLRISFALGHLLSTTNYGKIYRNGVAVGTERIAGAAGGGIYTTYTEDIAGWSDGDLLQVYCYKTGTHDPGVKNLIIVGRNIVIPKIVENLTDQDP